MEQKGNGDPTAIVGVIRIRSPQLAHVYCHDSMSNVHHITSKYHGLWASSAVAARLAQLAEHQTFNLRVLFHLDHSLLIRCIACKTN